MKKSDLKSGMVVYTRNKGYGIVLGNTIVSLENAGGVSLDHFNEDLLVVRLLSADWSITKVYDEIDDLSGACMPWYCANVGNFVDGRTLLWQRPEKPVETIKIGENTYNKTEFEEAIKNLKPIK